MPPRWIVDANNVMGARPDGWWRDRSAALHRLLDEVIRWHDETGGEVTVVADGHPSARVPEGVLYGVDVRFARSTGRDAADDIIVGLVEEGSDAASVVVVTSDRGLIERVVQLRAATEGARRFLTRLADIATRAADRAVLVRFGIDESSLLGRGGEARVFAIDEERVLRLPHPGVPEAALEERRRLLDAILTPAVLRTPEVLEHCEVDGRIVVVERRLPGSSAMELLAAANTDRGALVRAHLDAASRIQELPCPVGHFGEVFGSWAIAAPTFREWASARLAASLAQAGPEFAGVDPAALTDDLIAALPPLDGAAPTLVHLDAYLGNMLGENAHITAVVDFGPTTIGGPADLDPLAAIAYLDEEITPTATAADRAAAAEWAAERGLSDALAPARRWLAAYWTGAPDDERLRGWCMRVLLLT